MSASPAATSSALAVRQGKTRARDLAWLPKDVLSLVLTHVLLKTAQGPATQSSWDSEPELWQQREAFVTLKLAQAALNIINVCPPWYKALNDHPFWRTACHVMDPADHYPALLASLAMPQGMSAASVRRFRPSADTYRNLTNFFCAACRVNRAFDIRGGPNVMVKRWMPSSHFGLVAVCRDHRFVHVCGVCLRESSALAPRESPFEPGVTENDDDDAFPGLAATCTSCRQDTLCAQLDRNGLLSALGGRNFDRAESDLKGTLDAYVDLADGDIATLVVLAAERVWLRDHTRMRDMMAQMVAATRFQDGEDAEMLAEEDDDEMDLDVSWAEEANARELALGEWARTRILEGIWTSPCDDYGRPDLLAFQQNCAVHPVPELADAAKPQPFKPHAPIPAAGLLHGIARAYYLNLRSVLWPALLNIANRMIAAHDSIERAQEEACAISRSPELAEWLLARCAEEKTWRQMVPGASPAAQRHVHTRSDSSSTSSGEHSPTSPASTTTMRTTPDSCSSEALGAPVAHAVPWVPTALPRGAGPLHETRFVLERTWKDACCAALYAPCRCAACLRIAPPPAPPATTTDNPRKRSSEETSSDDGGGGGGGGTYKRQRTDSLDSNRARAATIEREREGGADWPVTPPRQGQVAPALPPRLRGGVGREEDEDVEMAAYYGADLDGEAEEEEELEDDDEEFVDALKMSLEGT